jgi:hypothetical protein
MPNIPVQSRFGAIFYPDDPQEPGDEEDSEPLPDVGGDPLVCLCEECYTSLSKKKVPPASLVRVDTGGLPRSSDIDRVLARPARDIAPFKLEPLTLMEERLLGIKQASRLVTIMRSSGGDSTLHQWRWRGHVIAFQNVDIEEVSKCFSVNIDDVPSHMQASEGRIQVGIWAFVRILQDRREKNII